MSKPTDKVHLDRTWFTDR